MTTLQGRLRAALAATLLVVLAGVFAASLRPALSAASSRQPAQRTSGQASDSVLIYGPTEWTDDDTDPSRWVVNLDDFIADSLAGWRYVVEMVHGVTGITSASFSVYGQEWVGTSQFGSSTVQVLQAVDVKAGNNTYVLKMRGSFGSTVVLRIVRVKDPTYNVYWLSSASKRRIFVRPATGGTAQVDTFRTTGQGGPTYTLHALNGDSLGAHRITSATVSINSTLVLSAMDFGTGSASAQRDVNLKTAGAVDTITVINTSATGTRATFWVTATDTTPPVLTLSTPADDTTYTSMNSITFTGTVVDFVPGLVTLSTGGTAAAPGAFNLNLSLPHDGCYPTTVTAIAASGLSRALSRVVYRDSLPPSLAVTLASGDSTATTLNTDSLFITWADTTLTTVSVDGDPVASGKSGAARAFYVLDPGPNGILIEAVDRLGHKSSLKRYVYCTPHETTTPRDSTVAATGVSSTEATAFRSSIGFLYRGSSPSQSGLDTTQLVSGMEAVLRGRVLARDFGPIPNVLVTVLGHLEFGGTLSREDGRFDLVVNGGQPLVLCFTKDQFLQAQRRVEVPAQDFALTDDVALVGRSARSIYVNGDSSQMVVGRSESDDNGDRRLRMLVAPGTRCSVLTAGNLLTTLPQFHVRLKEYTVGPNGPQTMPGSLPPSTAYTYCIDMSVVEADSLNPSGAPAPQVTFNTPIITYVKEFLGLPVGAAVPSGYYDTRTGSWVATEDGVVVRVLGVTGGLATLDTDGDSLADASSRQDSLGIDTAERTQVAKLYATGDVLWRARVRHFTSLDFNPNQAANANAGATTAANADAPVKQVKSPCEKRGCVIDVENRVLGETIPVTGTPYSLSYRSNRQPGDIAMRSLRIPITGTKVPAGLRRAILQVDVAGKRYARIISSPGANHVEPFSDWDGKDVYGRRVQGSVEATVRIGFDFASSYSVSQFGALSFANGGATSSTGSLASSGPRDVGRIEWSTQRVSLGAPSMASAGLGGWTLSPHHVYDATGEGTVYRGDGSEILGFRQYPILTVFAGTGTSPDQYSIRCADGASATGFTAVFGPRDLAAGSGGDVYFTDLHAVGRVTRNGLYYRIAGNSSFADGDYVSDGTTANATALGQPQAIAITADSSIIFTDTEYSRVYRVTRGKLYLVAGNPSGVTQDDTLATAYKFATGSYNVPTSVAIGPDGAVFIGTTTRIFRVGPDGRIRKYAGTGSAGTDPGGPGGAGKATTVAIFGAEDMVCDQTGALYFTEWSMHRVRRVSPDGGMTTCYRDPGQTLYPRSICIGPDGQLRIAQYGGGYTVWASILRLNPDSTVTTEAGVPDLNTDFTGQDKQFARAAALRNISSVALGPDGSMYIAEYATNANNSCGIYRVARELPGANGGEWLYPSEDGSEVYVFSTAGRHLRTENAMTHVVECRFDYDVSGQLAHVIDANADTTSINRTGTSITITAPRGQITTLALDGDGFLHTVANPNNEQYTLGYQGGGLLTSLESPRHNTWTYTYGSSDGRLDVDEDPAGGSNTLAMTETGLSRTVVDETAEGRQSQYVATQDGAGGLHRTVIGADGAVDSLVDGVADYASGQLGERIWRYGSAGELTTTQPARDSRFSWFAPVDSVVTTTLPSGQILTVTQARLLSGSKFFESTAINGHRAVATYDTTTRVLTERSAAGRMANLQFDAKGRPTSVNRPGQSTLNLAYDAHGRLIHRTQDGRAWTYDYTDAKGRLHSVTDTLGRVTTLLYDNADRVTSQVLPGNRAVGYGYDANGNLTSLTPPGSSAHTFGYTAVDLDSAYTPPSVPGISTPTTRYEFNRDRQLTRVTRPDGTLIRVAYNTNTGQVDSLTQARGRNSFTYSANGQLLTATSPDNVTLTCGYDGPLLRDESWTGLRPGGASDIVSTTVNIGFQDSVQTIQGAAPVGYGYDADGLLTSVTVNGSTETITHREGDGLDSTTSVGSVTSTLSYNSHGELWKLVYAWPGNGSFQQVIDRDSLGRVVKITETGFIANVQQVTTYRYNTAGQLDSVALNGVKVGYTYSLNGNRMARRGANNGDTTTATYDAQDRMIRYGKGRYTYTDAGELVKRVVLAGDTLRTTYDALGNLTGVHLKTGDSLVYFIDGANRRVARVLNLKRTATWLYGNALNVAAQEDSTGTVVLRYAYGTQGHVPDLLVKGGVTYRLITDQLGSVRAVVNITSGAKAQRTDYDAWGVRTKDSLGTFQPLGYAGGLTDSLTGLIRFGARDYDPGVGRWTTKDQEELMAWELNSYGYVEGDPIGRRDPAGLYWVYMQPTGLWYWVDPRTGIQTLVGVGYSGNGEGLNNPDMEDVPNVGPIPRGAWDIGPFFDDPDNGGPSQARLTPAPGTNPHGRGGIKIHGDNRKRNHSASHGCPIADRDVRDRIKRRPSRRLWVR